MDGILRINWHNIFRTSFHQKAYKNEFAKQNTGYYFLFCYDFTVKNGTVKLMNYGRKKP
jgi:hypothetical protein